MRLTNLCFSVFLGSALLLVGFAFEARSAQPDEIGKAASVKRKVLGKKETKTVRLKTGDKVFLNETIETGKGARGEFIFDDDTKLAVGPNARVTLDKFVYDPASKNSDIVLNATKGAFRFITGKSGSASYRIKTPTASIAVRGTIFDGYIKDNGELAILLIEGGVDVCGVHGTCRPLDRRGHFIHVSPAGIVSDALKWDGSFMTGIALATAFPFVGVRLAIDPVRRLTHTGLYGGRLLKRGGSRALKRTIKRPGKTLRVVPRAIKKGFRF